MKDRPRKDNLSTKKPVVEPKESLAYRAIKDILYGIFMVSLYTLSVLISHKLYNVYVPQSILDMYTCSVTYEMLHCTRYVPVWT